MTEIPIEMPIARLQVSEQPQPAAAAARYLVCGLGSLGQYCVTVLKEFGAIVSAIDVAEPSHWDVKDLPDLLETLVLGDCRQSEILQRANMMPLVVVSDFTNALPQAVECKRPQTCCMSCPPCCPCRSISRRHCG